MSSAKLDNILWIRRLKRQLIFFKNSSINVLVFEKKWTDDIVCSGYKKSRMSVAQTSNTDQNVDGERMERKPDRRLRINGARKV
jgi:hypothetical protein